MVEKLIVIIMGQNAERFIGMALESVKDADKIIFVDGGSTDKTEKIIGEFNGQGGHVLCSVIHHKYNQDCKKMNGVQRNFYLDYIKDAYPDWWCLAIDCDEIVEDLSKIKEFIQEAVPGVYSPRMRHLIRDLAHEDAVQPINYVLHRLFKIDKAHKYPEVEHPVLIPKEGSGYGGINCTTIWHLAYIQGMFDIKKKYENHLKKSQMHTKEYLRDWYYQHLFDTYPVSDIKSYQLPKALLEGFGIEYDEVYFATHRKIELKHFLMMKQWCERFKAKHILDLGCGMGVYGYVAKAFRIPYVGIEISDWVIKNNIYNLDIQKGDITKKIETERTWDLVLVLDVLEHIDYKDLDKTLKLISTYGKNYMFSLPYRGDPNLDEDPTHKIKESREWWVKKLSKYFKIEDAPEDWYYNHQLLVGFKK